MVLIVLVAGAVFGRTWHINTAGTGDAPTIAAGADSAVAGDTVLVAPGTYAVRDVSIGPGVVLTSEGGAAVTHITEEAPDVVYGVGCFSHPDGSPPSEVSGLWFERFTASVGAVGAGGQYTDLTVRYCVFTGNDWGLVATLSSHVHILNCTFVTNDVGLSPGADVEMSYTIMWDFQAGSITGYFDDYLDPGNAAGNNGVGYFSQDPQFCGETVGNYYLQSDSPCAPGNFDAMVGLIGALPVGCGPVGTEPASWGRVKSLYR